VYGKQLALITADRPGSLRALPVLTVDAGLPSMSGVLAFSWSSIAAPGPPARAIVQQMGAATIHHATHIVEVSDPDDAVALGLHRLGRMNSRIGTGGNPQIWLAVTGFVERPGTMEVSGQQATDDLQRVSELYQQGGVDALTRLSGGFAVVLWDPRAQELVVINDRFGLYPHYWAHTTAGFAVAPELKALLRMPSLTPRLDPVAIGEYVRFQQLLDDRTWFTGIKVLPPATVARFTPRDGRLRLEPYWNWSRIGRRRRVKLPDAAADVDTLLDRAVRARLTSVTRPGVYLSGGLDSRMLLGYMPREPRVVALTYGTETCRDVVLARRLADVAGAAHQVFPLKDGHWVLQHAALHAALTEGMHGWHHMHGMTTLDAARQSIDVNLTGWGGGSLLAGYQLRDGLHGSEPHAPDTEQSLLDRLYRSFCQRFTWPGLTDDEAGSVLDRCGGVPLDGLAHESMRQSLAKTALFPEDRRADYYYNLQHDRRSTMSLVVFHRSAMEVRCPYFDYELIDYVYALPPEVRLDPRLRRMTMAIRMRDLARVPYDHDWRLPLARSPRRAIHRLGVALGTRVHRWIPSLFGLPDTLYADYENYLRAELREWAEDLLLSPRAVDRGFFDPDAVRDLWEHHLSGTQQWTIGKIAPLMTIELVMRSLVD